VITKRKVYRHWPNVIVGALFVTPPAGLWVLWASYHDRTFPSATCPLLATPIGLFALLFMVRPRVILDDNGVKAVKAIGTVKVAWPDARFAAADNSLRLQRVDGQTVELVHPLARRSVRRPAGWPYLARVAHEINAEIERRRKAKRRTTSPEMTG
jgi:hypothetical protein